jgi:phenylacetate-CoA ligase
MFYGPQEREIMALLRGRSMHMHGIRPGDIVQVTLSLGLSNAGLLLREAIWKYSGAVPLMTGSGNSTPSRRQIEIAGAWGTTVIVGFPSYLRHLAIVSRDDMKIDPKSLGIRILHSHLGLEDRKIIEEMWGAPCYDSYGIHEAGLMASECTNQTGMHIFEDAYFLEIADPETGRPVSAGHKGNIYITSLYRSDVPVIRYNVNDVSAIMSGTCACGSTLLRLEKIFGRSDNMVKLRGTNIFPEAVGVLIEEDPRTTGEFFCIVEQVAPVGREEMTVMVEVIEDTVERSIVRHDLERRLREALGVKIKVQLVERGALDHYTGVTKTSNVKRLLDKRKANA